MLAWLSRTQIAATSRRINGYYTDDFFAASSDSEIYKSSIIMVAFVFENLNELTLIHTLSFSELLFYTLYSLHMLNMLYQARLITDYHLYSR